MMKLTDRIPIVHVLTDVVQQGEVRNPARPEGNVTGITLQPASIGAKYVDLLRELAPEVQQIGWLTDTTNSTAYVITAARDTARADGLEFVQLPFKSEDELPAVIGEWAAQPRRGLLPNGALALSNRATIVREVAAHRMPAVFPHLLFAEAGGVLTYATDQFDVMRRGAEYVGLILNGSRVADLPVQDPTVFTLVVNLKAAKEQGITVPQSLVVRADQVVA
jgi:putative ABC transport system substrate-binding protein